MIVGYIMCYRDYIMCYRVCGALKRGPAFGQIESVGGEGGYKVGPQCGN